MALVAILVLERNGPAEGRPLVDTVEIDGTFLEVETFLDDAAGLPAALDAIRAVMADLGIGERDLTADLYTDAVKAARWQ